MILQEQLGKPQQLHSFVDLPPWHVPINVGLLGNSLSQAPTTLLIADSIVDAYRRLLGASQPTFKLALLKQLKFAPEGKEQRIASSLAALNAAQPTELSLAQWKEIVEEIEDDED